MRSAIASVVLAVLASCSSTSYSVGDPTTYSVAEPTRDAVAGPSADSTSGPASDSNLGLSREASSESLDALLDTQTPPQTFEQISAAGPPKPRAYAQGMIGESTTTVDSLDMGGGNTFISADDMTSPYFAGAYQQKFGGDKLGFGLEGGMALNWNADVVAFSAGGGGLAIAADTNSFLADFFGGAYADMLLGRVRLYAAGGPTLQWATIDLDWSDNNGFHSINGDGFGYGWYARAGLEFLVSPGTWIGFGGRYVDATVDFGGALGDMDYTADQWFVTFTHSM